MPMQHATCNMQPKSSHKHRGSSKVHFPTCFPVQCVPRRVCKPQLLSVPRQYTCSTQQFPLKQHQPITEVRIIRSSEVCSFSPIDRGQLVSSNMIALHGPKQYVRISYYRYLVLRSTIYKSSETCIIWLGPHQHRSSEEIGTAR